MVFRVFELEEVVHVEFGEDQARLGVLEVLNPLLVVDQARRGVDDLMGVAHEHHREAVLGRKRVRLQVDGPLQELGGSPLVARGVQGLSHEVRDRDVLLSVKGLLAVHVRSPRVLVVPILQVDAGLVLPGLGHVHDLDVLLPSVQDLVKDLLRDVIPLLESEADAKAVGGKHVPRAVLHSLLEHGERRVQVLLTGLLVPSPGLLEAREEVHSPQRRLHKVGLALAVLVHLPNVNVGLPRLSLG